MGMGSKLVDTEAEDIAVPSFVFEQARIDMAIKVLRERGENEMADMLEVHLDEAEEACKG